MKIYSHSLYFATGVGIKIKIKLKRNMNINVASKRSDFNFPHGSMEQMKVAYECTVN